MANRVFVIHVYHSLGQSPRQSQHLWLVLILRLRVLAEVVSVIGMAKRIFACHRGDRVGKFDGIFDII